MSPTRSGRALFNRREVLQIGAAAGAGLALSGVAPGVLKALAAPSAPGSLGDIEHFVIVIQENRSFDHYFGALAGVRGWRDALTPQGGRRPPLYQAWPQNSTDPPAGYLLPFRFDTENSNAECTSDITHDWAPQHLAWNGGRMDRFVKAHLAADPGADGLQTMGYYTRADLPFYYAIADAFTICDGYHCSVIGPTDPNRLMSMTGWLDPDGRNGGPLLTTLTSNRAQNLFTFSWTTYPEQLQARGISWKVYGNPDGNFGDNTLAYFKQYQDPSSPLFQNAFLPTFPGTYQADVLAGTLPQVSWVLSSLAASEHPPGPPQQGEDVLNQVLTPFTQNPSLWAKTAVIYTYDENGGFFDHVPPPAAPPGTPGEWITATPVVTGAAVLGDPPIRGPIGLGFRVPCLVISPFSRGGFVCSDVFDHTSTLQLLERRFGAEVANLSRWRRETVGDLTTAFNFAEPDASIPALPPTSETVQGLAECAATPQNLGTLGGQAGVPYTIPNPQTLPRQEPGGRRRPSGEVSAAAAGGSGGQGSRSGSGTGSGGSGSGAGGQVAGTVRGATAGSAGRLAATGAGELEMAGAVVGLAALAVGAAIRLRTRRSGGAQRSSQTTSQ